MAQTKEDLKVINLEPIGGGKVRRKEFEETLSNIFKEVKKLGNDSTKNGSTSKPTTQVETPSRFDTVKRYVIYGSASIAAIWLIGKALE